MLIRPLEERLRERKGALTTWRRGIAHARRIEKGGDSFVFHGTSMECAQSILRIGFHRMMGFNLLDQDTSGVHVYWGPLRYALNFAARHSYPAILAAPLADVLASGTPLPMTSDDRLLEDEPELETWQQSHAESGCLRVLGGTHVANMQLIHADPVIAQKAGNHGEIGLNAIP